VRIPFLPPKWAKDDLWTKARKVPSLDLRFADNKSLVDATTGSNLVTFTRASSGTFVGSDGLIKTASTDVPRFDHNPTTGESLGLLVEEQRVNLALQSEDFSTTWTTTRASVSTNAIAAPNGTTTADKLVEDNTATNTHFVQQSASVTSGTSYTSSIYVKAAERNFVQLVLNGQFASVVSAIFDLSTGAVGTTTGTPTTSATQLANGWWRFSVTQTANATGSTLVQVRVANSSTTATYTGDGASGIYIWGAQLEAGAFPTSYIPTTTATVTRSADVASISGSNFSSWYRQDEGTVFADYGVGGGTQNRYPFTISDNTTNNRITLFNSSSTVLNARVTVANVATNPGNLSVFATGASKVAIAVAAANNGAIAASNGGLSTAASPAVMPVVDRAYIGLSHNGAEPLNGSVKRLTYWPTRLPNSTLQAVTQ
jgi:hypothetical protein